MKWVIGIDEVGRGPLAGPVYVCAVAMKAHAYRRMKWHGLTDSKRMMPEARIRWHKKAQLLEQKGMLAIALSYRSAASIDRQGIAACIKSCIKSALGQLELTPSDCRVLLDGALIAPQDYARQRTIIKGDLKEPIISLASVLAKVTRDRRITDLHKKYPEYHWAQNKGYGTRAHISTLLKKGISPLHRKSFLAAILDKKNK